MNIVRAFARRVKNLLPWSFKTFYLLPSIWRCRAIQKEFIGSLNLTKYRTVELFFIPEPKGVTGGVLQIYSLHRMSGDILSESGGIALICRFPGESYSFYKYEGFENDVIVLSLDLILKSLGDDCGLRFHLPEFSACRLLNAMGSKNLNRLRNRYGLKLNILNQNIEQMLSVAEINSIKLTFPDLTCTVGNPCWADEREREKFAIPLHAIPTWYYPDSAPALPYREKKNILMVSPDRVDEKDGILSLIKSGLPNLEIKIITGLKYEDYLYYEKHAKWSLTFGEGLDGYFYGPVLRGGIAFAKRNGTFDVLKLDDIETVYPTYNDMAANIIDDIKRFDNEGPYEAYNGFLRGPTKENFICRDKAFEGLKNFYLGNYTLP